MKLPDIEASTRLYNNGKNCCIFSITELRLLGSISVCEFSEKLKNHIANINKTVTVFLNNSPYFLPAVNLFASKPNNAAISIYGITSIKYPKILHK